MTGGGGLARIVARSGSWGTEASRGSEGFCAGFDRACLTSFENWLLGIKVRSGATLARQA